MVWMKDLVLKISYAGQIVVDPCVGIFATANACMMVPKCGQFIGCDIEPACFDASMLSVVEVSARQVLNEESDIVGSQRVRAAAKTYSETANAVSAKCHVLICNSAPRRSVTQTVSLHT